MKEDGEQRGRGDVDNFFSGRLLIIPGTRV